jgi:putative NADH-flavin reductase
MDIGEVFMSYVAARALKVAVYGAQSPLGQALMTELLSREHEAVPLQADLKTLPPRPYPPVSSGNAFSAHKVSQVVAGMKAVVAVLDTPRAPAPAEDPAYLVDAVAALISGLRKVKVSQLLLVGDFSVIDDDDVDPRWRQVCQKIHERLDTSPLHWTMVNCTSPEERKADDALTSIAEEHELLHLAAEVADVLEKPGHSGRHLNLDF